MSRYHDDEKSREKLQVNKRYRQHHCLLAHPLWLPRSEAGVLVGTEPDLPYQEQLRSPHVVVSAKISDGLGAPIVLIHQPTIPVDSKSVDETASAGEFLVDSLPSSDGLSCPDWLRRQPLTLCATVSMPRSARAPACLLDGCRQISWDKREAHKDEICPRAADTRVFVFRIHSMPRGEPS